MKSKIVLAALVSILLACGCILSDELTTLIIHPDGSADWYRFKSNIRSSDTGEKGTQELSRLIADFEARKGAEFERIVEAGGSRNSFTPQRGMSSCLWNGKLLRNSRFESVP